MKNPHAGNPAWGDDLAVPPVLYGPESAFLSLITRRKRPVLTGKLRAVHFSFATEALSICLPLCQLQAKEIFPFKAASFYHPTIRKSNSDIFISVSSMHTSIEYSLQ
ncbi:MAG: hypothetical protein IJ083_01415 [Clostridia bacterium]|nr:hypothetical protein [Clostridia bacterium]